MGIHYPPPTAFNEPRPTHCPDCGEFFQNGDLLAPHGPVRHLDCGNPRG